MLVDLIGFVTEVVERLGYVGVMLLVALENLFPPIPSEIILPLAGFNVYEGDFSFPIVLLFATLGSVLGALLLYFFGAAVGAARLRKLVRVHGGKVFVEERDVDSAESWFRRYGPIAVFLCRMVPIVRSLISLPAGVERMPLGQFIILSTAGSLLWNVALIGAGWVLGTQWHRVEEVISTYQLLVIVVGVAVVAWFIWVRVLPRLRGSKG